MEMTLLSAAYPKDGICCNFFQSVFSQIDVCYNDRLLTESTNNYAYVAYIKTLMESTAAQIHYQEPHNSSDKNVE